jgi:hypothetical protein
MSTRKRHQLEDDRAKIERLLLARTQAEPLVGSKKLLRLLGWPVSRLRTLEREVRAIRSDVARRHANFNKTGKLVPAIWSEESMLDVNKLDKILAGLKSINDRLDADDRERAADRERLDALQKRADAVSEAYAGDPLRQEQGLPPPFDPAPGTDSPTRH